jgi:putative spermidine/putrescine transport system substrate-binding protein
MDRGGEQSRATRRTLLKYGLGAVTAAALSPLAGGLRRLAFAGQAPSMGSQATMGALIAAAKKEGELNVIALPPDWANYGEIIQTFSKTYGIKVNSASPNASSAEELAAVKSLRGQRRAPDVLDLGPAFAIQGAKEGLFAPYKHSRWITVSPSMKDSTGLWVGGYYGVIALGANRDVVKEMPKTWADLKKPEYKGQVALNGDPRRAGAAFAGVWSAALANGGSLDNIQPGIDFFAELKKSGNFIPVDATPATVQSGQTPITVDWDYLQIGYSKEFAGKIKWEVGLPTDGVFGSYYAQAINRQAPHPNAARLWQEFLFSDGGQILWLKGFAHPARFNDLVSRGVVPADLLAKLPPAEPYKNVRFPSVAQNDKAKALIAAQWGSKVTGK